MLAPIRPRPTIPICMSTDSEGPRKVPANSLAGVSSSATGSMHPSLSTLGSDPMSKLALLCATALVLACGNAAHAADEAPIPKFGPDVATAWTSDRPASDDFLPPPSGPGPVLSDKAHPYTPNGQGQSTYRIADITNPILKPWVVEQLRKTNEDVLAGKVPYIARERCWPGGVPGLDIYNRGQPVHFIQTANEVVIINELYASTRHVYLN